MDAPPGDRGGFLFTHSPLDFQGAEFFGEKQWMHPFLCRFGAVIL
jgi:hypothetical protein